MFSNFRNLSSDFGSMISLGLAPLGSFASFPRINSSIPSASAPLAFYAQRKQQRQQKDCKKLQNASFEATPPSKKTNKTKGPDKTKTLLPEDFEPTPYTVLCGRSRDCYESVGNRRFRLVCNSFLQQYLDAPGKLEKSRIVSQVMRMIRLNAPVGAFVAFEDGRYYEVSERTAREKVGGFFRDSLPAEYKSSAKAKLAKKKALEHHQEPDVATSTSSGSSASSGFASSSQNYKQQQRQRPVSLMENYAASLPLQFSSSSSNLFAHQLNTIDISQPQQQNPPTGLNSRAFNF